MKNLKTKIICSKGFTLVEVIVTIMAAGILGAIFIQFMGTALNSSWNAVEIVRDEADAEGVMEQIIADYVANINNDPTIALNNIVTKYNGQTIDGIHITTQYTEFDGTGKEVSPALNDTLKVILKSSGPVSPAITGRYSMMTILTNSRTAIDDPIVLY
ncbi:MAG: prepilin-type N-terminal cleavage/methylation domain-containing protein [Desulfobacterales bacterium]